MNKTPIQWTDATWNPVLGCKETSPGCAERYAARLIGTRMSRNPKLPMYHDLATVGANGHPHFTGVRRLVADRLDEPLRAKRGRKVFVCDMGDLFFEQRPFEDIAQVFAVMALAQQHTFQVLTKRASRMREFFQWASGGRHIWEAAQQIQMPRGANKPSSGWPLPNVWLGASVEDEERKKRIGDLVKCPAPVRFLSVEPQIEHITLDLPDAIHWVICGGESGPRARPFDLAWARSLRDECAVSGAAFFMKQAGAFPVADEALWRADPTMPLLSASKDRRAPAGTVALAFEDSHGGNLNELPADLRVREFPAVSR